MPVAHGKNRCRVRAVRRMTVIVGALTCLSGGCASTDVQVHGREVTGSNLSYEFGPVSPQWRSIQIEENDAAWFDAASRGTVHVDHTCDRSQDTPLPALVQHLLIGFTDRETQLEETIPFDRREARHVVVRARLDGVPRAMELYVMKKDGCVYDLGFVAPPESFESGRGAFTAFAMGFHTGRSPLDEGR